MTEQVARRADDSELQSNAATVKSRSRRGRMLKIPRVWPGWLLSVIQIGIVIAIVALWEIAARAQWIDAFFWSSPSKIMETMRTFVENGSAFVDTWFTFRSTILAFVLGTVCGAVIGLSFWWSRNYAKIAQPFLICFEATPKLALAPLIVLVFGIGLASKVAIGIALTIVVTTLTTFAGVRVIDPDSEKLMYSLGASRRQVFFKLVIPSVLPWIISSLRVNIGLALTGAVIGEFIASEQGLGRQILYASQVYDLALIWVAIVILATLSVVMYLTVGHLEKLLLKGLMHETSQM
jgi:NitT/TauT family transport system permease protein